MSYATSEEDIYARKYRAMKKKLRLLVYEREAFIEELKKSQRKLLKVSRDKSFLLDRLLRYEEPRDSSTSSDSDSTESSDGAESSASMYRDRKRKAVYQSASATTIPSAIAASKTASESAVKKRSPAAKVKLSKQQAAAGQWNSTVTQPGGSDQSLVCDSLTRQEVERQLELKRIVRPQFMNIDATPSSLPPDDIFSHDNSNSAAEIGEMGGFITRVKEEDDDANLVIDMAN